MTDYVQVAREKEAKHFLSPKGGEAFFVARKTATEEPYVSGCKGKRGEVFLCCKKDSCVSGCITKGGEVFCEAKMTGTEESCVPGCMSENGRK